jgi:hypothetical protein
MPDKLTVTVERIDGGKLRCTSSASRRTVVIYPGEALEFRSVVDAVRCAIEVQNGTVRAQRRPSARTED